MKASIVNLWNCLIYAFGEIILNNERHKGWFSLVTEVLSLCYHLLAGEKLKSN